MAEWVAWLVIGLRQVAVKVGRAWRWLFGSESPPRPEER